MHIVIKRRFQVSRQYSELMVFLDRQSILNYISRSDFSPEKPLFYLKTSQSIYIHFTIMFILVFCILSFFTLGAILTSWTEYMERMSLISAGKRGRGTMCWIKNLNTIHKRVNINLLGLFN